MPSGSCRSYSSSIDEFFRPLLSRGNHASIDGSSKPPKKYAPGGGAVFGGVFHCEVNIYHIFAENQSLKPSPICHGGSAASSNH